ncbi:3' terminal RNA ribose 2'-O-methyltransferase Hen1 [Actinomadura sp. WMMB 499]|uniref:3' terminal RNA ribose 2'-O-methyltransferase Hen1 n=1 Tax=Actinomadura sp. WMMB 499 TaxID=1219491 RepID=UPI0012494902|nr:3' terminal RNA ribose 2'-O-methyltransferase Hen1 [Actinomadura sp. WMMB 499]QFG20847.1 3' terminal RNA ribose 2'-O-methyltransferase Hen1 [Actinomadura sp. WMMB 499]
MLLTITTTLSPASDLGFLLHKHPDRVQTFDQAYGTAHVLYPEADERRCTAALLLDVDPVKLVRTRGRGTPDFSLGQFVNDRPYAASSLLASAMANVYRTAMRGRCDLRPELAGTPIPLEITLPALPCRGGPGQAERFFGPLGWTVSAEPVPLDPGFPSWGDSRYVTLTLTGTVRLSDALNQLYVLLPVLDDAKHYWVASDEVDKLIRAGEGWLAAHPDRGAITRRYLANRRTLVRAALGRLADAEDAPEEALDPVEIEEEPPADGEHAAAGPEGAEHAGSRENAENDGSGGNAEAAEEEPRASLAERRIRAVTDVLREEGAGSVIDLGCGSGKLLARLLKDGSFTAVAGADVSFRAVEHARRRLRLDRPGPSRARDRVGDLFQGALTYADDRFGGYDAAVLMEVVEHIDPPRLGAVEKVVFGHAAPRVVVVTTPNAEHNVRYEGLAPGAMRHPDHRFEWTRAEFRAWADRVAAAHGYRVRHVPVGDDDPEVGAPTQMGVFTK